VAEADRSLRLLLTEDRIEADRLSHELDASNTIRRQVEAEVLDQAVERVEREGLQQRNVIVLADEGWHEGVVGIVASRVADRFYRPAILIALDGERGKGSGRSIPGFHLHAALKSCAEVLAGFGGHKYAAGLSIERSRVDDFERMINEYAGALLTPDLLQRRLQVDARVELALVTPDLLKMLKMFEPFGIDNPRPVFAAMGLEVVGFPRKVGDNHLRFTVRDDKGAFLPAIAFGRAADLLRIEVGKPGHLDIAFQPDEHSYAGKRSLQLTVKDMKLH
jgi:single-stranded-DNA-specific exonuclease